MKTFYSSKEIQRPITKWFVNISHIPHSIIFWTGTEETEAHKSTSLYAAHLITAVKSFIAQTHEEIWNLKFVKRVFLKPKLKFLWRSFNLSELKRISLHLELVFWRLKRQFSSIAGSALLSSLKANRFHTCKFNHFRVNFLLTFFTDSYHLPLYRHDRTSRQPMNLKWDVSVPVPPVPFLTSW